MPKLPKFSSDREAAEWFAKHDTSPYMKDLREVKAKIPVARKTRTNGGTATEDESVIEKRNENVIHLIKDWIADKSGYDEEVWPLVKQRIEENRLSARKRFRD
jgi:hypothetical protein